MRLALTTLVATLLLWGCLGGPDSSSRELGEGCGCESECVEGLHCVDERGEIVRSEEAIIGVTCEGDGTCEPGRGTGEACGYGIPCGGGFQCVGVEGQKVCSTPLGEGGVCGDDADCQSGLVCNGGLEPPECGARAGEDGACIVDEDCQAGLGCNRTGQIGHCVRLGSLGVGERCDDDALCAPELLCYDLYDCKPTSDGRGATCYPFRVECAPPGTSVGGDPCSRDEECSSGQCLEPVDLSGRRCA